MTTLSRNAPCPCGSGRKYKHCCLDRREEPTTELGRLARQLLAEEDDAHRAIFDWMKRRFGRDWATPPLDVVLLGEEVDDANSQILVPWLAHLFPFDGATPAARYAAERGPKLMESERRAIDTHGAAYLSLWEVRRIEPGVGMELFDLLTRQTRFVHDVAASRTMEVWTVILAAIAVYPQVCVFCGMHGSALTPQEAAMAIREARRAAGVRTRPAKVARLRDPQFQIEILHLWSEFLMVRELAPRREVTNTDGDPLLLCTDHFEVSLSNRDEVLRRLGTLEGAQVHESDGDVTVYFMRASIGRFGSAGRTEIGRAWFDGKWLKVESNSQTRADVLRARVVEAAGPLALHRTRKAVDPLTVIEQSPPDRRERESPLESDPRVRAAMREFIERHYATWPDIALPALDGLTPREAACTPRSRERLVTLLKQMEFHDARKEEWQRYDFRKVRRELGLASLESS